MENKGKKRRSLDKPACKYGSTCYQKNPEHREKFKHPNDDHEDVNKSAKLNDLILMTELPCGEKGNVLKDMPPDFFDFWDFCSGINNAEPQDALQEIGLYLVGMYDFHAKQVTTYNAVEMFCHWRYYYDPPEFQTVIRSKGKDFFHIGYFRDDPSELPSIVASNSVRAGYNLTLMGDNIFAAVNSEISKALKRLKSKSLKDKFEKIQTDLQKIAKKKKYPLEINTSKTKARSKNVVAKTFHELGIVVPVDKKTNVGYRPIPDSDAQVKSLLKRIVTAPNDKKRMDEEESLHELMSNVHFANDECDYGMGLELGIDLFCFGDPLLNSHVLAFLPLAYSLLQRPLYAEIVKYHIKQRRKDEPVITLID